MDREVCVLIYSQYSLASQKLVEYIKILPYDFAAVTGMTFLAADSQDIRDSLLSKLNINEVPCIYIKYFDGRVAVYHSDNLFRFIDSITRSFIPQNLPEEHVAQQPIRQQHVVAPPPSPQQQQDDEIIIEEPKIPASFIKRDKIMEVATAMFKQREDVEKARSAAAAPIPPNRTPL